MGIPARRSGGGGVVGVDMLSERAAQMREALVKSQSITVNMVSILGSFDHRLSALETTMRPTQIVTSLSWSNDFAFYFILLPNCSSSQVFPGIRTHAIRRAHENIDKTLKAAEVILSQFDLSRQAEAKILKGPHEDLESYLQAIDQLRNNIQFFSNNKSFKSSDGVLNHTNNLLVRAISKLQEEFKQLLSSYRHGDLSCLSSKLSYIASMTNEGTETLKNEFVRLESILDEIMKKHQVSTPSTPTPAAQCKNIIKDPIGVRSKGMQIKGVQKGPKKQQKCSVCKNYGQKKTTCVSRKRRANDRSRLLSDNEDTTESKSEGSESEGYDSDDTPARKRSRF